MLELKLALDNQEDAAGKRIILTDNTGDYNSLTNTTGYGTPNLNRTDIAVFPIGYLHKSDGSASLVEFDSYNMLGNTSWNALASIDGWYSFQLVYALVDQNPIITNYQLDDVLFSLPDFKLVKVGLDSTNSLSFIDIKPEDLLTNNSSQIVDQLFLANLSFEKISLNRRKIELMIDSENLTNLKQIRVVQEAYDRVRSIIQGAIYEFCIGNKYEAARFVEFILTNNYEEL